MAFSSIAELRGNIVKFTIAEIADALVTDRIAAADKCVRSNLSGVIDFSLVTDTPAGCPIPMNLLSQYKTCELSLVFKYSAKRMALEQTDYQYWQKLYNDLLAKIMSGEVDLDIAGADTKTFTQDHRKGVSPALGQGINGEYLNEDEIKNLRADLGSQDDE